MLHQNPAFFVFLREDQADAPQKETSDIVKDFATYLGPIGMKITNPIRTWFKRMENGLLQKLARCYRSVVGAEELPAKRLIAIEIAPPVSFKPRLNFRQPSLDRLHNPDAFRRIERTMSAKSLRALQHQASF